MDHKSSVDINSDRVLNKHFGVTVNGTDTMKTNNANTLDQNNNKKKGEDMSKVKDLFGDVSVRHIHNHLPLNT